MHLVRRLSIALIATSLAVGCGKGSSASSKPPTPQKDGSEGLKALFQDAATHCKNDKAKGKALALSTLPAKAQIQKALKDGAGEIADKISAQVEEMRSKSGDDKISCAFSPEGRTEIRVHASTTEDLIAYKEGTPAFEEFPGGARKLAEQALRPGVTFYEVETIEPGKDSGTKFHLFFWDGAQWRMLGPAWRAIKE